jgi:hypothetical protein
VTNKVEYIKLALYVKLRIIYITTRTQQMIESNNFLLRHKPTSIEGFPGHFDDNILATDVCIEREYRTFGKYEIPSI